MAGNKWNARGIEVARTVAKWSKDKSTQVGAVVMMEDGTPLTFAYNGFARGVNDDVACRHERPEKYKWTSHAEENAIANMARIGATAFGATLYVTHFPCAGCARKIIQAGIARVVVDGSSMTDDFKSRWEEDMTVSREMFGEGGVEVVVVET
ncbi:deaminase [Terasakiella sp.]|uniref:deaminase n=1 Tax=Terasakiella sp. TaxID=2034861 RepID=UPI003AA8B2BD